MSVRSIRKELGCLSLCVSAPVGMLGLLVVVFFIGMDAVPEIASRRNQREGHSAGRYTNTPLTDYWSSYSPTIVSSFSPTVHAVFLPASQNQCLLWYSATGLLSVCSYLQKTQQALRSDLAAVVTSNQVPVVGFRVTSLMPQPDKEKESDKELEYPAISPR